MARQAVKKDVKRGVRRGLRIALLVLLSLFLLLILGGASVFAYVYCTTDYTVDEELFEMAKGSRTTRLYYNAAEPAASGEDGGLVERVSQLSLSPSRKDPEGSNAAEDLKYYLPEGYIAAELENQELFDNGNGIWCPLEEMPGHLRDAFVAIEDRRFYSHAGVDWWRTAQAAVNYIFGYDSRFGGSTITQQLIKNISSDNEISVSRKLREICRAIHLEERHSKEEILELYLNIVPLSRGCVGVGAAAEVFYGKKPADLTLAEAAALAAVTNSPARYDPVACREGNATRRRIILAEMHAQGMIGEAELRAALADEPAIAPGAEQKAAVYGWYTETVLSDVLRDLQQKRGLSREAAEKLLFRGGLEIYTLMEREVQTTLEEYFSDLSHLPLACRSGLQMGMTVIDPSTGALLGVVGGVGKKTDNRILNYATDALRAPGSAIKPLSVYAPAIEEGLITYSSVFDDVPLSFSGRTPWPQNSPAVYKGLTDLPTAVALSKNTVAVRAFRRLGAERSYYYLTRRLGFSTLVRGRYQADGGKLTDLAEAPLALGQLSDGVSVRAMTAAYVPLANGGIYYPSRSYALVLDGRGRVLLENPAEGQRAFRDTTASLMTELLRGVVEEGTARSIRLDSRLDVAGKTGTSGEGRDKWFVGYTPYLVGGIWCGYPDGERSVPEGGPTHLTVWDAVMERLHRRPLADSREPESFTQAPGLVRVAYCRDSGMLPCEACRLDPRGGRVAVGLFVRGTEPREICRCHELVEYDVDGQGVASDGCPAERRTPVGLIRAEGRDFPYQIYVEDAQFTLPRGEDYPLPGGHYSGVSRTEDGRQFNDYCTADHGEEYEDGEAGGDDGRIPWLIRHFRGLFG